MTMSSLLEISLGIIMAFGDDGNVIFINSIGREELGYDGSDVNISDILTTVFDGSEDYDGFVRANTGKLMKTVAYRRNNTCFPIALRFAKMTFMDVEDINVIAGLNMQTEEDAIKSLEKAEEEMKENAKSRDLFVANVTHELRTPVNGIKGHLKVLMDTEYDAKRKSTMEIIMQCCSNMEKIINNLLDYSKMESGKFEINEKPFDVRNCIENVMAVSSSIANEKGIRFSSFIGEDIPQVLIGDELRITQILNNLISNALKFTSAGYVTLEVYKTQQRADKIELTFFVTDTGIGISPEGKEKLFKSFSQADGSITRKYGGTGLGLFVTKQLIELMHGHIEVESEEGKGSTFTFTIQLQTEREESEMHELVEEMQELSIESLRDNSLGSMTRFETEQMYIFGSDLNKKELSSNLEKLLLCVEMENWEKAEMFADNIKGLCEGGDQDVKSKTFRLVMSVRKEDYDKSISFAYQVRDLLKN
jgi:signal transduction histidine kinase